MVEVMMKNQRSDRLTLVLVNIAGIMEKADESLLPGVYKEVGKDLHTDPTGLGSLTVFRSLVQCLCYPLAAYLAARHNRAHVIALGAFLWSAATFLVAFSSTFTQLKHLLWGSLAGESPSIWLVFPIFAEIVPQRARTSIYALDRSFETTHVLCSIGGWARAQQVFVATNPKGINRPTGN
ncbi:hypothetical protein HAX54_046915 [Datura stramonium]|uniref:Major facilitator superfamily (MFS) profile domain-containing protein n=1 Tax=Datura stramonium TaxID=4076 RepID=A0ABS8SS78_DATST|nr:hypothetical protein [Datura stramonium]